MTLDDLRQKAISDWRAAFVIAFRNSSDEELDRICENIDTFALLTANTTKQAAMEHAYGPTTEVEGFGVAWVSYQTWRVARDEGIEAAMLWKLANG